jgi:hypothetical protein
VRFRGACISSVCNASGLGGACVISSDCAAGLECYAYSGTCVEEAGGACSLGSQCGTQACGTSGTCTCSDLGQYCVTTADCCPSSGLECVYAAGSDAKYGHCYVAEGDTCLENSQCASDVCNSTYGWCNCGANGFCNGEAIVQSLCGSNADCCPENNELCLDGSCKWEVGTTGCACGGTENGGACTSNTCSSNTCVCSSASGTEPVNAFETVCFRVY